MTGILDYYKILGVSAGAGIADVTSSYRKLCRKYHPDINGDPGAEEHMKRINIAYSVLREKLARDALIRERQAYSRPARRYTGPDVRSRDQESGRGSQETDQEAYSVLDSYFRLINACDYSGAYDLLSNYDQRYITRESFISWRKSVARLYPMRGFGIAGGMPAATVSFRDGRNLHARKFRVAVTEDNFTEEPAQQGDVEKFVIKENGVWKVFLGYKGVGDITRSFDERFEDGRKREIAKRWEDYYTGLSQEYDMLGMAGLRKAASREFYRQKRFGGALSFAAVSIKSGGDGGIGQEELLRSAARTITGALRETDIPAYAGDGVFAILFVELRKRNLEEIVARLAELIRKNAGPLLGRKAVIDFAVESWTGQDPADIDGLNRVLKKFHKKV